MLRAPEWDPDLSSNLIELRFSGLEPFVWDKEVHIRASSLAKLTVLMGRD